MNGTHNLIHYFDSIESPDEKLRAFNFVENEIDRLTKDYKKIIDKNGIASAAASVLKRLDSEVKADNKNVTCKKGCAFCCYITRDVTVDEAELIKVHMLNQGIKISRDLLEKQRGKQLEEFDKLSLADRRCPFLNKRSECKIYEFRPSRCMNHRVITPPADCDTEIDMGKRIGLKVKFEIEVLMSAILNFSETKLMADALLNTLSDECFY